MRFAALHGHEYELASDEVIFGVFARRNGVPLDQREKARAEFFAKGQPCLWTSPLAKTYGWGIHSDAQGRVALVPMESERYAALLDDDETVKRAALRSSRRG